MDGRATRSSSARLVHVTTLNQILSGLACRRLGRRSLPVYIGAAMWFYLRERVSRNGAGQSEQAPGPYVQC